MSDATTGHVEITFYGGPRDGGTQELSLGPNTSFGDGALFLAATPTGRHLYKVHYVHGNHRKLRATYLGPQK